MSKLKSIIVTLGDDHVSKIEEVANECETRGMILGEKLEILGQITGQIDPKEEASLREIPGVLSIDESYEIELPPPESDIQ